MTAPTRPRGNPAGRPTRRQGWRARAVALAVALALLAGPAAAQPTDGETYDDWRVRCDRAKDNAPPQCHIFQVVVVGEARQPILYVALADPPDRSTGPVVFLTLPLGVHLPSGVTLRVDDRDPVAVPLEHCDRDGCHAKLGLDQDLVWSLKAGRVAHIAFRDGVGQSIDVPISLKGFTGAFKTLR